MDYDFVSGDTGSVLTVNIKDSVTQAAVSIQGSTVTLKWEDASGAVVSRVMTIVDAAAGKAKYKFAASELFAPKMRLEVEVVDSEGNKVTGLQLIEVLVRESSL